MMLTSEQQVRVGMLQELCNRFGDFKVCIIWKHGEERTASKWRSVLECWEKGDLWFLARANNRQIFPNEIVLDLDTDISQEALDKACQTVENLGLKYEAYFTGSRGWHIHVYDKDLLAYDPSTRSIIRSWLIAKLDCDLMKASERSMIAIPGIPHFKTGQIKRLVRSHP